MGARRACRTGIIMMPPLRLVRVRVVKIMIIATGSGTNVSPRWVHASSALRLYFSTFVTRKGIMISSSATVTDLAPTLELEEVEAEDAELR